MKPNHLSLDGTTDEKVFRSVHGWSDYVGDHRGAGRSARDRVAVSAEAHDEIELYEMLITEVGEAVGRLQRRRRPLQVAV